MTTCGSYVVLKEKHPGLWHEQKPEAISTESVSAALPSQARDSAACMVASLSVTMPLRSGMTAPHPPRPGLSRAATAARCKLHGNHELGRVEISS